jgi:serine/threonine protein kinase
MGAFGLVCSAKDTLTGSSVAIKKILKPFSTPVLSKRTYRELKLLKHIKHENIISLSDIFISPLEDIYFVTELLGTDLHRLLTSRPLEKQFIQYFLYQILVSQQSYILFSSSPLISDSYLIITERVEIRPLGRSYPSRPQTLQHLDQREL